MLHESAHVRITAQAGVATLWLGFPGDPVNAFDRARLLELDSALEVLEVNPFLTRVVVRSAKPGGFCAGLHPAAAASLTHPADRAAFATLGQRVFARLAALPVLTIAFIEGPCLGAGLELALACDHRLCLASRGNHLGFPHGPPGFGGSARLAARIGATRTNQLITSKRTLSGREARDLGFVDRAFCERRAKIELQTFLNDWENRPWEPRRVELTGLAEERRAFAASPVGPARMPAEPEPAIALARGFITPLEYEQMLPEVAPAPPIERRQAA